MTNKSEIDNRMGWIRGYDNYIKKWKEKTVFTYEYEIFSECRIPGVLKFGDGYITCNQYSLNPNEQGLHSYLLRISACEDINEQCTPEGYCFKGGVTKEILVLLEYFYTARFYEKSVVFKMETVNSNPIKAEKQLDFVRIRERICPVFFEDKVSFYRFENFLNRVISLSIKDQWEFINSINCFSKALHMIGRDDELFFVFMVSSIEVLSTNFPLKLIDDPLKKYKLEDLIQPNKDPRIYDEMRRLFDLRKATRKFIRFVEKYSNGFFSKGRSPIGKIKKSELNSVLGNIYSARSKYVHNGSMLYLSLPFLSTVENDMDPFLGASYDNKKFKKKEKLPYTWWLIKIISYCIDKYIKTKFSR